MSVWLFDLGNSRLKFAALHEDGRIGEMVAIAYGSTGFAAGWDVALPPRIDAAHVASVVAPALRVELLDALTRRCPRISLACTRPAFAGVRIAYAQPHRFGVDRFLCLLAAHARGAGSWLVIGVGTALTIDLLDAQGRHRGGRIAPSPALMRAALHRRAPHLPDTGGDYITDDCTGGNYREFADDTDDALASGCVGAALGLIERSRQAAASMLGAAPQLLLHGGDSPLLLPHLADAISAPGLVLEGLARWARPESGGAV